MPGKKIVFFSTNEARSLTELTANLLGLDAFHANAQLLHALSTLAQIGSAQSLTCSQSQMKKIKQCCVQLSKASSWFSGLIAEDVSDARAGLQVSAALDAFDKSRMILNQLTLNLTTRAPSYKQHGYMFRALSLEEFNAVTDECFAKQLLCYFENPMNSCDESKAHYKVVEIDGQVKQGVILMEDIDYIDDIDVDTVSTDLIMKLFYPKLKQHDVLAPIWEKGGLSMQLMIASGIQTLLELQMAAFLMRQGFVSPIDVLKKVTCLKSNEAHLWHGFCAVTSTQHDVSRAYLAALDSFVSQIKDNAYAQALLAVAPSDIHEALSTGCEGYTFDVEQVLSMMRMQHRLSEYVIERRWQQSYVQPRALPMSAKPRMDVDVFVMAAVGLLLHPEKLNMNKALLFSFATVMLMGMMQKAQGHEMSDASEGVVVHAKR